MSEREEDIAISFRSAIPSGVEVGNTAKNIFEISGREFGARPEVLVSKFHPFEAYVIGYTSDTSETAYVQVFNGTVIDSEDDCTASEITDLDETFEVSDGTLCWIEADFADDGTINSLELKTGTTWTGFPAIFDTYSGGNKWYHLIFQARPCRRGKRPETPTPPTPAPNPGEFPEIKPDIKIVQKTNTNLMKAQICAGEDKNLIWALVPGPGGIELPPP